MRGLVVAICCALLAVQSAAVTGQYKSWEHGFYAGCGALGSRLKKFSEDGTTVLRFRLENGDKGNCRSDRKKRHGAPFWERAELSSYKKNIDGLIVGKVKFESGFEGDRETFFQIHSASGDCNSRPVLMMKWDYGYFSLWAMSKKLLGSEYFNQFHDFVGNHLDRWIPIEIAIKGTKFLFVKFDGRVLLENYDFYYSESCGATKVKFGIYRPGQQDGSNNTSVASFKEIRIGSLENQK